MARVAHLLTAGGVPPHKVMTITFTNRAADELKERLKTQVGTAIAAKLTTGGGSWSTLLFQSNNKAQTAAAP